MLLLSSPIIRAGYSWVAAALFAVGLGLGLITGPIATAAMANAPAARSGLSSGLVNVGRMVGATLGVAALGIVFGGRIEAAAQDVPRFMEGGRFPDGGCGGVRRRRDCPTLVSQETGHQDATSA